MKTQAGFKLLTLTLIYLLLALLLIIICFNCKLTSQITAPQTQTTGTISARLPVLLIIPTIGVNSAIEHVGLTSKREMELPKNAFSVGWYRLGPRPGEKGSAVIAGHFNNENGDAGVFFNLYKLKKGDKIHIKDDGGTSIVFVVQKSQLFDFGLAGEVFSLNDGIAHLNLVTCDGVWDGSKKSYSKRLVIFADRELTR